MSFHFWMNHSIKTEWKQIFTSIFWSKEMKIPLLISELPRFSMDAGIWKHWSWKTDITDNNKLTENKTAGEVWHQWKYVY